jgi:hypothetical protein
VSDLNQDKELTIWPQRSVWMAAGAALAVPGGLAAIVDWRGISDGHVFSAWAQLGGLAGVMLGLAILLHLVVAIGPGRNFCSRLILNLMGVGLIVFAGVKWLTVFDGTAGQGVLVVSRFLTFAMMLLLVGYLLQLAGAARRRFGIGSLEPGQSEAGSEVKT